MGAWIVQCFCGSSEVPHVPPAEMRHKHINPVAHNERQPDLMAVFCRGLGHPSTEAAAQLFPSSLDSVFTQA